MDKKLESFLPNILNQVGAKSLLSIAKMQSLWSDYGAIYRLKLNGAKMPSVVVKCIALQKRGDPPRGWTGNRSHQRKLKSYAIENHWYKSYAASLPSSVKVPMLLYTQQTSSAQVMVLEDLAIHYPILKQNCSFSEAEAVVKWLAQFHAHFINSTSKGLWPNGSYWHLATRPDEWQAMADSALKEKAGELDSALSCAKFQTIIHGDAKVANFCFAEDNSVAAVDFQYVGKGIGVKDVAYFLGSCFSSEECALYEKGLLDFYFEELSASNKVLAGQEQAALEKEWRALYPVAWADFNRFLLGWLPSHQKLHSHAIGKNKEALSYLSSL